MAQDKKDKTFGDYFKELRRGKRLTLREFCRRADVDPGNTSKIERGILPPPRYKVLARYAQVLGISTESEEWTNLIHRAIITKKKNLESEMANEWKEV